MTTTTLPAPPEQAGGDVVTVGHEIGHIATDGTIIGRAEPYAKVFPSSRQVKRAVGVMAWAILEDIALDARIDHAGRLVAATNVRRIADNLGVSKNTVAAHLTRLRDAGFVLHEEGDHDPSGRYTVSRYVLDPSACVERFTHTPPRHDQPAAPPDESTDGVRGDFDPPGDPEPDQDDADAELTVDGGDILDHPGDAGRTPGHNAESTVRNGDDILDQPIRAARSPRHHAEPSDRAESSAGGGSGPCTNPWDTAGSTVSQSVGHRELGHNRQEVVVLEEQHRAREGPAASHVTTTALVDAGIAPARAADLATRHPPDRIADVLDAATARQPDNPPGWLITALNDGWDVHDLARHARSQRVHHRHQAAQRAGRQRADNTAASHARTQHRQSQDWADLAAALLDDHQLARLIQRLRDPRFPLSSTSVRLATAQVTGWVAAACHHHPDLQPADAIATALTDPARVAPPEVLPPPPPTGEPTIALNRRIATLLAMPKVVPPTGDSQAA